MAYASVRSATEYKLVGWLASGEFLKKGLRYKLIFGFGEGSTIGMHELKCHRKCHT
jgi:hypothetical protein